MEWARWFENVENRRIRLTKVGPCLVSTVFLGLDQRFATEYGTGLPIVFETMAWEEDRHAEIHTEIGRVDFPVRDKFLDIQERCATWDEAVAQHERVIGQVKQPGDPIEEILEPTHS
jgi:hypothetical protein